MPYLRLDPWNIIEKDYVIFIYAKLFNSDNFLIVSETRNAIVPFDEKPQFVKSEWTPFPKFVGNLAQLSIYHNLA